MVLTLSFLTFAYASDAVAQAPPVQVPAAAQASPTFDAARATDAWLARQCQVRRRRVRMHALKAATGLMHCKFFTACSSCGGSWHPAGPVRCKTGIQIDGVYVVDQSRQTTRISANVSGLLGTDRILLNDNLLKQCSLQEIEAVVGHEMGHYVLHHAFKNAGHCAASLPPCAR